MTNFVLAWHPEKAVDGFSLVVGTVMFFSFVRSLCLKTEVSDVLDYGGGRGMYWYEDPSQYRTALRYLRDTGATVTDCDIDGAVLSHACSQKQVQIKPGEQLSSPMRAST